jgi:hypothetical protein
MIYQAFIVTASGYYTVIQNSSPQSSRDLLEDLVTIVGKIRYGKGSWYDLAVVEVTDDGTPTPESRQILQNVSTDLFKRLSQ